MCFCLLEAEKQVLPVLVVRMQVPPSRGRHMRVTKYSGSISSSPRVSHTLCRSAILLHRTSTRQHVTLLGDRFNFRRAGAFGTARCPAAVPAVTASPSRRDSMFAAIPAANVSTSTRSRHRGTTAAAERVSRSWPLPSVVSL